jgi:hypothetical protein
LRAGAAGECGSASQPQKTIAQEMIARIVVGSMLSSFF